MNSPSEHAVTESAAPKVTSRKTLGRTPADVQRKLAAQERRDSRNRLRAKKHARGQANYYFANQET